MPLGPSDDEPLSRSLVALGLTAIALTALLTAALCVLLSPTRVGTVLVPVGIVVALVMNVALPRLAHEISQSRVAAALPVMLYLAGALALSTGPGGDVLLPGGSGAQTAISYGTLLAGLVAGGISVARL